MKLLRHGPRGQECPALIDAAGRIGVPWSGIEGLGAQRQAVHAWDARLRDS